MAVIRVGRKIGPFSTVVFGRPTFSAFEPEALALFAAMTTAPTLVRQLLINACIVALKAAGAWPRLDVLQVYAAGNAQAASLNWRFPASSTAAAVNSPVFTPDRGYTGDGATSYVNTNYTPGPSYTLSSATAGIWSRTIGGEAGVALSGLTGGARRLELVPRTAGNTATFRANDSVDSSVASVDGTGLFIEERNAEAFNKLMYRNGAIFHTAIVGPVAVPITPVTVLANPGVSYSTREIAAFLGGSAMAPATHAGIYDALLTYMQAVGAA